MKPVISLADYSIFWPANDGVTGYSYSEAFWYDVK